jgi:hypothetical protein
MGDLLTIDGFEASNCMLIGVGFVAANTTNLHQGYDTTSK